MKKRILLFSFITLLLCVTTYAQQWKTLNRLQKDSVIHSYFKKGDTYISLGVLPAIIFGGWQGFGYKIEPAYGYFIRNRQLIGASAIIERGKIQVDNDYQKNMQYTIGGFYRYYLPERKTYTSLFTQAGVHTGKFYGWRNIGGKYDEIDFYVLNISVGIGISIPINKFNLELGINQIFQLLNQKNYNDNYGIRMLGIINFSYLF